MSLARDEPCHLCYWLRTDGCGEKEPGFWKQDGVGRISSVLKSSLLSWSGKFSYFSRTLMYVIGCYRRIYLKGDGRNDHSNVWKGLGTVPGTS